jgi:hypothetical protein
VTLHWENGRGILNLRECHGILFYGGEIVKWLILIRSRFWLVQPTTDGVEFATDPTYDDITVDQQMDAVRIFKSGMSASVSTTMAEATLENLVVAWGQASTTASALGATESELTIEAGGLGDAPVERGLIAVGNAPEIATGGKFGQRVYHLYRVLSVEGSTVNNSRTDATTIPVTFRALPDDSTGRYGTIRDRFGANGFG